MDLLEHLVIICVYMLISNITQPNNDIIAINYDL